MSLLSVPDNIIGGPSTNETITRLPLPEPPASVFERGKPPFVLARAPGCGLCRQRAAPARRAPRPTVIAGNQRVDESATPTATGVITTNALSSPCISAENLLHPHEAGTVAGADQLRERRPASRRSNSTTVHGGDSPVLPFRRRHASTRLASPPPPARPRQGPTPACVPTPTPTPPGDGSTLGHFRGAAGCRAARSSRPCAAALARRRRRRSARRRACAGSRPRRRT
jgi:hypothetical protein